MAKDRGYAMSWKGIVLSVGLNLIFAFFAAVMIAGYFRDVDMQKIVDQGVIVEAEIVGVKGGGTQFSASLVYKYVDNNKIEYIGETGGDFNSREEAQKYIGRKVEIYIGISGLTGSPVCRAVSKGTDLKAYDNLIFAGIFLFLIILYMVLLIIYLLAYYEKLPKRKKKEEKLEKD